jgi:nifR3 family TIM-barrel protein
VTPTITAPPGPLRLGPIVLDVPVVLAPMAGITNPAFRTLCRRHGAGLYISEMITARALVEANPRTHRMLAPGPDEPIRSVQLYGVDPTVVGRSVRILVEEWGVDHVDLNFGCPVPKVTRKGGGAAVPWRRRLFGAIVTAAVDAAAPAGVPVTVKMRKGIDDDHLTFVEAGRIAQDAGVAWVALHARTAAERYSGSADWHAIGQLKAALDVPVLGNGDIWEADDALAMTAETGCDGVMVGRGCLGRPWLFADLATGFSGSPGRARPALGDVAATMRDHAGLLVDWLDDERRGVTDFRKHVAWYLKGFPAGADVRRSLATASSLSELDELLARLDRAAPWPDSEIGKPRGRTTSPAPVHLPDGWLADRDDPSVPFGADIDNSGG